MSQNQIHLSKCTKITATSWSIIQIIPVSIAFIAMLAAIKWCQVIHHNASFHLVRPCVMRIAYFWTVMMDTVNGTIFLALTLIMEVKP